MERIGVKKNILMGFIALDWILALILMLADKEACASRQVKKICVTTFICTVGLAIPFIDAVVLVFYIIFIVQMFRGNYDYECILLGKLADVFLGN